MKTYVVAYLSVGLIVTCLDAVWLTLMTDAFYRPALGDMLLETLKVGPAAVYYLIHILGIVVFAVTPAFGTARWTTALGRGAFFGLCAFATYDLTNQATLKGWPAIVTLVDIAWGILLTGTAATLGYLIAAAILRRLVGQPR